MTGYSSANGFIRIIHTVKNVVYRNTPGEQYFHVSMITHTVTMETGKYCSPWEFSYTTFLSRHRSAET